MLGLLAPLILQASTALPVVATPLEEGRWVIRDTRERNTGLGGISASLLSEDGRYRLVVRCDYSYAKDISLQLLPMDTQMAKPVRPAALSWGPQSPPLDLVWEEAGPGVFARNGADTDEASIAAAQLEKTRGTLYFIGEATDGSGISAVFRNTRDRDAIGQVRAACA